MKLILKDKTHPLNIWYGKQQNVVPGTESQRHGHIDTETHSFQDPSSYIMRSFKEKTNYNYTYAFTFVFPI